MTVRLKRIAIIIAAFLVLSDADAQSSADIQEYIKRYSQIALEHERLYGVPATITLAQGILESGAGQSSLTRNTNNHFGIKAGRSWNGEVYLAWDDEADKSRFRCYGSAEESFADHSRLLKDNRRYSSLFSNSVYDYRAWAKGLQEAGYATAENYASALIGYIDTYRLYTVNGGVKLRPGKTVTITNYIMVDQPSFDADCVMDDSEESSEEQEVTKVLKSFVVEVNNVRCTILYPGESLATISRKYDIPQKKILEYNELANETSVHPGDVIFLAKKKKKYSGLQDSYVIRDGDTLYSVAQQFGIQMSTLAKLNGMSLFSALRQGDVVELK